MFGNNAYILNTKYSKCRKLIKSINTRQGVNQNCLKWLGNFIIFIFLKIIKPYCVNEQMIISTYWLGINIMIHEDYKNTIKFELDFL